MCIEVLFFLNLFRECNKMLRSLLEESRAATCNTSALYIFWLHNFVPNDFQHKLKKFLHRCSKIHRSTILKQVPPQFKLSLLIHRLLFVYIRVLEVVKYIVQLRIYVNYAFLGTKLCSQKIYSAYFVNESQILKHSLSFKSCFVLFCLCFCKQT